MSELNVRKSSQVLGRACERLGPRDERRPGLIGTLRVGSWNLRPQNWN